MRIAVACLAFALLQPLCAQPLGVELSCKDTGGWTIGKTVSEPEPGVTLVHVRMNRPEKAPPPRFRVEWSVPQRDIAHLWTPRGERASVPPDWSGTCSSGIARGIPLMALINGNDGNRMTFGCSESTRTLLFHAGLNEETCTFRCHAEFFSEPEAPLSRYEADIRLDCRQVAWHDAVSSMARWMSSGDMAACTPPAAAYEPVYSTWYGFHQSVSADQIERECALAAPLGMKTLIMDDGWQTDDASRGYAFCGDWKVSSGRIPDMKRHVAAIHGLGMKYMLWYSVPFVGERSENYGRFKGKYLYDNRRVGASVLDPRFPEVRAFLADLYERALREWGLDGFKLDFIDAFGIPQEGDPAIADGYAGRDIKSVPEAVRTLIDEISRRLRAVNPDVLIEFRQNYYGPQIRRYGNMVRAADCPGDMQANLMRTVSLRLVCPGTSVHSDMLEWHGDESARSAARGILACLFSTVQYSRIIGSMKPEHLRMMTHWMAFMREHRSTLLFGGLRPHHPEANYPLVEADGEHETIAAVYTAGTVVPVGMGRVTYVVNATGADGVVVDSATCGTCRVFDVFGAECGTAALQTGLNKVAVPASGYTRVDPATFVGVNSPDGANEIRFAPGSLTYEVLRRGKVVIANSAVGLETEEGWLESASSPLVSRREISGSVRTPLYRKCSVDLSGNEAYVDLGKWGIRLVARNDGVAYRLELAGGPARIRSERAEVSLAEPDARCWVNYSGAFGMEESIAQAVKARDIRTDSSDTRRNWSGRRFVCLPLVCETEGGVVAVTDAGVRNYPIWNLTRDTPGDKVRMQALFAGWPRREVRAEASPTNWYERIPLASGGRWVAVAEHDDYLVDATGPRSLPWRAFVLADRAISLCEADLVRALSVPEGQSADFSWVKPGLCAWDWWNCFDNRGNDGICTATYERFIDFASKHGIPYLIMDEGWCMDLDIHRVNPAVDLPRLAKHAKNRGVGLILWLAWPQAYGREAETAEYFASLGAKGLKVDFLDRGDAKALRFMESFAEACARSRLVVDYHGVCRPVGLEARYPNVLNFEGVHGLEKMKACEEADCDFMLNDLRVFFVRMTAGFVDYTPGAMLNFAKGTYRHDGVHPGSYGTRCHQMALYILYEAPLQMLCDSPSNYEANQECLEFLRGIPTAWKGTRGLEGTPDTHAVVAREAQDGSWYVAGMANWDGRSVAVDTSFLPAGSWRLEAFFDTPDGGENPRRFLHETKTVMAGDKISVAMAPGGGFAMKFTNIP